jgi:uncharacterized protein (TIGR02300 family)
MEFSMSSTSLGTKRHCQSCGKNFYDLEKLPIVCPLCSTVFDPEVLLKSSRVKATSQAPVKKVDTSTTSDDEDLDDDLDVEDDDLNDDDMLDDDSDIVSIAGSDMKDDDEEIEVSADDALDDDLDDQDDD